MLDTKNFDSHECKLPNVKSCKRIDVINITDCSYKNKKLVTGFGVDGILYTFEVVQRKPIPLVTPIRRIFTEKKSDKDFTEPDNMLNS